MDKKMSKKYLITGSNGLVGSALKELLGDGHIYHTRNDVDLLDLKKTKDYIEYNIKQNNVDTIIHCAAKVGGVQANMNNNKLFFYENFVMNNNLMQVCFENDLPNFVNLLSTCIFPDKGVKYPLDPSQINNDKPHFSNHGYSYAKRLSGIQTEYINNVLGKNWFSIIPTNVYGENDNFNLEDGHVIPALIHKAYLCKKNNTQIKIWGDGSPLRQIIYSKDLAKLIIWSIENWNSNKPFMAVNPNEYSILEITNQICKSFEINEEIEFDLNKPMGQFKKPAITNAPDNFEFTDVETGIKNTTDWFIKNFDTLRK